MPGKVSSTFEGFTIHGEVPPCYPTEVSSSCRTDAQRHGNWGVEGGADRETQPPCEASRERLRLKCKLSRNTVTGSGSGSHSADDVHSPAEASFSVVFLKPTDR